MGLGGVTAKLSHDYPTLKRAMHTNTIEFVRPGRATHAWVARTVAELKGGDPLAPVTLVVPNYYAGRQIRWTLAMAGGYVNVRSMLLGDLAEQIVGVDAT